MEGGAERGGGVQRGVGSRERVVEYRGVEQGVLRGVGNAEGWRGSAESGGGVQRGGGVQKVTYGRAERGGGGM